MPSQDLSLEQTNRLRANAESISERIEAAAERAGRSSSDIRVVAVTKKQPLAAAKALLALGHRDLGENRPDQLAQKAALLGPQAQWHMIGHLQRKKIPKLLPCLGMLHSLHDLKLMGTLDVKSLDAARDGRPLEVLIQVNVSGEAAKQGFEPRDAVDAFEMAEACVGLAPKGFMTMAPYGLTESELRRVFSELREIRDDLGVERAPELSMGMSGDFEAAIMEGATILRIGSAFFDGVNFDR